MLISLASGKAGIAETGFCILDWVCSALQPANNPKLNTQLNTKLNFFIIGCSNHFNHVKTCNQCYHT